MSSLWTPGGEVPVDRRPSGQERTPPPTAEAGGGGQPDPAAMEAELQRFLLETPAEQVVLQHAVGLYELAVVHLSQDQPRLADARLAIDALHALLDGLGDRLGQGGEQLNALLPQLQMAFVEVADQARSRSDP